MNYPPFFSVVVPLYNKEKHVRATLQSVINQTFQDFEIIIVDDGSTDNGCEVVDSLNDIRIRLVRQDNAGPSKARNRGINEATGKFIAFLDADDLWLPEKLEKHYELHTNNHKVAWSCTAYKVKAVEGYIIESIIFPQSGVLSDAIDALLDGLVILTSTVVVKKEIFRNNRLFFNEKFKRTEDVEVWYKLACLYPKIGYIKEEVVIYNSKTSGGLMDTLMEEEDFSCVSLRSRIDNELVLIDEARKYKLIKKIDKFNRDCIIGVWIEKKNFGHYKKLFSTCADENFLKVLNYSTSLPFIMKRIIIKLIRLYYE